VNGRNNISILQGSVPGEGGAGGGGHSQDAARRDAVMPPAAGRGFRVLFPLSCFRRLLYFPRLLWGQLEQGDPGFLAVMAVIVLAAAIAVFGGPVLWWWLGAG